MLWRALRRGTAVREEAAACLHKNDFGHFIRLSPVHMYTHAHTAHEPTESPELLFPLVLANSTGNHHPQSRHDDTKATTPSQNLQTHELRTDMTSQRSSPQGCLRQRQASIEHAKHAHVHTEGPIELILILAAWRRVFVVALPLAPSSSQIAPCKSAATCTLPDPDLHSRPSAEALLLRRRSLDIRL